MISQRLGTDVDGLRYSIAGLIGAGLGLVDAFFRIAVSILTGGVDAGHDPASSALPGVEGSGAPLLTALILLASSNVAVAGGVLHVHRPLPAAILFLSSGIAMVATPHLVGVGITLPGATAGFILVITAAASFIGRRKSS